MAHEDESGSMQRSLASELPGLHQDPYTSTLLRHIGGLETELAQLREAARGATREKQALEQTVARLRDANEHLILAAISAQGLRDDAEATNLRQNEFLAMLSHELRNPLVPISMSSMLLERTAAATPQVLTQVHHYSRVIRRQVDHMARLLDDLLDAARISSGKITLNLEPLALHEIVDQAVETVLPRVRERRQELDLSLPTTPVGTHGDRVRLTQVFTNLLGNASKYTGDNGRIALAVHVEEGQIVVTVTDNGSGIAPDVLPHIFDLFTQGPRSLARSEGGLGVGLNVVRNLVTMHHGSVHAHSDGPPPGSRFEVRLPLFELPAIEPPPARTQEAPVRQCQVLLIEDNVDACETLKAFLEMEGHETRTAHDGAEGLATLLEHPFDIVVCDIGLPGMDGLEVVSRLRASKDGARPVAIALSGYGQAEDRARALAAGFDHYLVKPVDPDALLALVAQRC